MSFTNVRNSRQIICWETLIMNMKIVIRLKLFPSSENGSVFRVRRFIRTQTEKQTRFWIGKRAS